MLEGFERRNCRLRYKAILMPLLQASRIRSRLWTPFNIVNLPGVRLWPESKLGKRSGFAIHEK